MEITNILETKTYLLTDEEKLLVIRNLLGREGLQLVKTFTNDEKEKYKTAKGLFSVISQKFN